MPNGVFHITNIITLFEFFLGTWPRFGLWRFFFGVKPWGDGDVVYDRGAANIYMRLDSDYFKLSLPMTSQAWQHAWFYTSDFFGDPANHGVPQFSNTPLKE